MKPSDADLHSDLSPGHQGLSLNNQTTMTADNGWLVVAVFIVAGATIGAVYTFYVGGKFPSVGAAIGAVIAGGIGAFEVGYVRQPWGRWLRRLPLPLFIGITLVVWMVFIVSSLEFMPALMGAEGDERYADAKYGQAYWSDLTFSTIVGLVFTSALRLRSLIGGRVLLNFLTGRYRQPVDESRIFLLDTTRSCATLSKPWSIRLPNTVARSISTSETRS